MNYNIIVIIILIILSAILLGGNYFYNLAILRRKKEFLKDDPDLEAATSGVAWDSGTEWIRRQNFEEIALKSLDGLTLAATWLSAPLSTKKTAILIHGYSACGTTMSSFARYYLEELGFNVLMPDCRGHGKSEGKYIGFGWHDRQDYLKWIEYVTGRVGEGSQIVLHGISMGGGTVLMTSGERLPENVKCIVSDCAYNSLEGILGYQMKRMYHLPKFPLLHMASLVSKLRAGYFFSEASALKQVRKSGTPILFIHGGEDRFVPTKMVHELYEATGSEKELLIVPGAAHGTSFWQDPKGYRAAVESFIKRYVK